MSNFELTLLIYFVIGVCSFVQLFYSTGINFFGQRVGRDFKDFWVSLLISVIWPARFFK